MNTQTNQTETRGIHGAAGVGIGIAISAVKEGAHIHRLGWNGKGMYVGLYTPTIANYLPYLFIKTVDGTFLPFVASQADLLANDWVITGN